MIHLSLVCSRDLFCIALFLVWNGDLSYNALFLVCNRDIFWNALLPMPVIVPRSWIELISDDIISLGKTAGVCDGKFNVTDGTNYGDLWISSSLNRSLLFLLKNCHTIYGSRYKLFIDEILLSLRRSSYAWLSSNSRTRASVSAAAASLCASIMFIGFLSSTFFILPYVQLPVPFNFPANDLLFLISFDVLLLLFITSFQVSCLKFYLSFQVWSLRVFTCGLLFCTDFFLFYLFGFDFCLSV